MAQIHKKLTNSHCIIIACKYIRTYMFYSVFSKQEIKLVFKLYARSMLAVIPTVQLYQWYEAGFRD